MTRSTVVLGVALILVAILGIIVFAAPTTGRFTPYAPLSPAAFSPMVPAVPVDAGHGRCASWQRTTPAHAGRWTGPWRCAGSSPVVVPSILPSGSPQPTTRPAKPPSATKSPVVGQLSGTATWQPLAGYVASPGPVLRALGIRPGHVVRVTLGRQHVDVRIYGWCACGPRQGIPTLLDLSSAAFARLAPLSAGVLRVTVVK